MKKILLLLLITVAGCASVETDTITITGTAVNRKGGPAVHTDGDVYFIEDAYYWDEKYVDKEVTITGVLKVVPNPEPEDKGVLVQRIEGVDHYNMLLKAKWTLAEGPAKQ